MIYKTVLCNLCGVRAKHIERNVTYKNGNVDREEFDWCKLDEHCVRGSVKRIIDGETGEIINQ